MGRTTVYNNLTSPEKIAMILPENMELVNDFITHLSSIGRSEMTVKNYKHDLTIFFCWVLDNLGNKRFVDITKREFARFQGTALNEWGWSSNRLRTVKAAISSLGNYIENILDDDYAGFRSVIRKVESPPKIEVREKTVWEAEEVSALIDRLIEEGHIDIAIYVALAAYGGRRKSELCRFKMSDFGDDHLVCGGSLYKSAPIKTKGGTMLNCYTLAKKFKPILDLWIAYREANNITSPYLLATKYYPDTQMKTPTIDRWNRKLSEMTGRDVYSHSFRHCFTTQLLKSGIPEGTVQTIIGWKSSDMVRVYDDRSQEDQIGAFFNEEADF